MAPPSAENVLYYRTVVADEWWNQLRHPDVGRPYYRDALEFLRPLGWYSYHHLFGMMTQRHILDHGTTPEQFGEVIVQSRRHALATSTALRREALSIEEYLASPLTVEPLREADDVIWGNGGCAVVAAAADRAADAPNGAAHIVATAQGMGTPAQVSFELWAKRADINASVLSLARQLFAGGLRVEDIGSLQCYDTMPISVVLALEGLGFCGIGEPATSSPTATSAPTARSPSAPTEVTPRAPTYTGSRRSSRRSAGCARAPTGRRLTTSR